MMVEHNRTSTSSSASMIDRAARDVTTMMMYVDTSSINATELVKKRMDVEYQSFYDTAQFITGLILYPMICIVGLTGNILVLIVLNQRKMITSTNVFLSALAIADLIKLLNDTLYFIVSILMRTNPTAGNHMMGYMYPISHYIFNESVCVASWLTVCIGLERFLYVCRYSQARKVCTVRRARVISASVFFIMSVISIPSALRYKRTSFIIDNRTVYKISLTSLGQNQYFMSMYMWIINLLRSVIPLCLLVMLNSCIIQALRKHRVKGKISRKNRITFMLIVVIIVFLVCITPDAVMSTVFGFGYVEGSYLVKGIRECTDTLLATNSAVNFTIYCVCSKGFRDTFQEVFCHSSLNLPMVNLDSMVRGDGRNNSSRPLLCPDSKKERHQRTLTAGALEEQPKNQFV